MECVTHCDAPRLCSITWMAKPREIPKKRAGWVRTGGEEGIRFRLCASLEGVTHNRMQTGVTDASPRVGERLAKAGGNHRTGLNGRFQARFLLVSCLALAAR